MTSYLPARLSDRVAWGGLLLGAGVVVLALVRYWGVVPGNADRFLILVGAAWAAHTLAPGWATLPTRPRPALGNGLVLLGGVAFAAATFLLMQIGPRTLLLWWLALALLAATTGVVWARLGFARWHAALFPLLFTLFALPIPLRVLNPLQDFLQANTTRLSHGALAGLGYEVVRNGFVLDLPGGQLRVEEACSGVRSVTALTAIAAFVAFLKGFGPARGAALLALSIPVIAAVNVLRVVLSGVIQEAFGSQYIREEWHEGLGFAMIFVGLGLILGLAKLVGLGLVAAPEVSGAAPTPPAGRRAGLATAGLVTLAVTLTLAGAGAGYREEVQSDVAAPLDEIALSFPGWTGHAQPVPAVVSDLLAPDRAIHRVYTNNVGQEVEVWAFYWQTGAAIKGYHHPDVCWGNKGFTATSRWVESVPCAGSPAVAVTAREFHQGRDRSVVLYWTQEGPHVWSDSDERAAEREMLASGWSGHQWVGRLLGATAQAGPRLQVVVIVPTSGTTAKKDAATLSQHVAAELYRVCPWAKPPLPPLLAAPVPPPPNPVGATQ